jgi:hypothetical protein
MRPVACSAFAGDNQFLIEQVPFTNVAQSDKLQKIELGADHSFPDDKLIDQVRQFGFPGIEGVKAEAKVSAI